MIAKPPKARREVNIQQAGQACGHAPNKEPYVNSFQAVTHPQQQQQPEEQQEPQTDIWHQNLTPACFCSPRQVCLKHATEEPTIDSVFEMLCTQLDSLDSFEHELRTNMQNISEKSANSILAVRDYFKENIGEIYA